MSLIEEALRKQQKNQASLPESDAVAAGAGGEAENNQLKLRRTSRPAIPTPVSGIENRPTAASGGNSPANPDATGDDGRDAAADEQPATAAAPPKRMFFPILLLFLTVCIIGGGALGAWILWRVYGPGSAAETVTEVKVVEETPVAQPATDVESAPAFPAEEPPDPPALVAEAPPETPAEEEPVAEIPPETPVETPVAETPLEPEDKDVAEEPVTAEEPQEPAKKEEVFEPDVDPPALRTVVWPALRLSGILGVGAAGEGSAILNGEVVGVGESIMGAELIEVTRQGVRLRKDGEERFMRIGGILE